jgi:tRNA dimethylallyltransferase
VSTGVLILTGSTASGKTALGIRLARAFDAEIVGMDSRQIYCGMPIGTAAPTLDERAGVPHHLIGFLDARERYSAARFVVDALAAIDAIHTRGKRALLVGGTGFYMRALCGDTTLSADRDDGLRARLAREVRLHPTEILADWLRALEPRRLDVPLDPYRLTRALEIALVARSGEPPAPGEPLPTLRSRGIAYRKLQLALEPAALAANIEARVDSMLAAGLIAEAEQVGEDALAADAVGYRDVFAYQRGEASERELRLLLARSTRRYAKRQATWFRTEPDLSVIRNANEALALARTFPAWM